MLIKKLKEYKNYLYSLFVVMSLKDHGYGIKFKSIKELYGQKFISIGNDTIFSYDLYLTAWETFAVNFEGKIVKQKFHPELTIGDNCNFGAYNHITCINKIKIGNDVLTGKWVTISDNNHGDSTIEDLRIPPMNRQLTSKGPVVIMDNVWIGDKATILSGVTIGEGSVIAANTVVTKDVPAYSVVAGVPGNIIKQVKK